jgi:hypothetical protein
VSYRPLDGAPAQLHDALIPDSKRASLTPTAQPKYRGLVTAQPDSSEPAEPGPDTGSYELIHLGGQAAVVVPVADFVRLRALEQAASPQELEDAEDTASVLEWKARDADGLTTFAPSYEARRRLGIHG